ncbi:MAG: aminotransferase class V-fold PLP-dependent enzyme [Bacteroidota bacterium]
MNIADIRKDTPGCTGKLFLNNAGASLNPKIVTDKIVEYLQQEQVVGGYQLAAAKDSEINEFYTEVAKLLNCNPENIAYANSATDAFFRALSAFTFKTGDVIVTSNDDYISNQIAFLSLKKQFHIDVIRADNLPNGDLDLNHFEELVKQHHPVLVSLAHIPTNSGLIQDAAAVGAICKKYNTWFLLDACQSAGQLELDVKKIGCDFLSAAGRKFMRGPRGTGFLYVSDKALDAGLSPSLIDMRGADWIAADDYKVQPDAKRFELFESSCALKLGLKEAVRYANTIGLQNIYNYNQQLIERLRNNLSALPGLTLLDKGSNRSNILTFTLNDANLSDVENHLTVNNVCYSVGFRNFALIDFNKKNVDWAIRFSPHYYNTLEEMDRAAEIVREIKKI